MKGILSDILYVFLPEECHVCGRHLSKWEHKLCGKCYSSLPRTLYHRMKDNPMELRLAGFIPFHRASALLFYSPDTAVTTIIHDFKYRKFPSLAYFMGKKMGEELLPPGFFTDIDMIVPIPMHWIKKMFRGYNQVELLAEGVHEVVNIPVDNCLRMRRYHKTQTKLSHEERRRNMEGLFKVVNPEELTDKHILILDDVCTTGATLRSAAAAILDANPKVRISFLTLAVT